MGGHESRTRRSMVCPSLARGSSRVAHGNGLRAQPGRSYPRITLTKDDQGGQALR